jgi:hypothetical protein
MEGKQLMLWLIGTDENDEAVDVRCSVGADWQTDDGNVITHPTKRQQRINMNTIYGHFMQYSFEIPELAKVLMDRSDQLGGKGPLDARIWLDLILHLQAKTIDYGPRIPKQERLMPTEYFGMTTDTAPASIAPAPSVAAPVPPSAPAVVESPPAAVDPQAMLAQARAAAAQPAISNGSPLYARALQLAQGAPDFATFLGQAFQDSDILADDELAEQCADQKLIWAAAHPA